MLWLSQNLRQPLICQQELPETIESQDLLDVVVDYTYALDTFDNYDYERLTIGKTTKEEPFHATYENAMQEIGRLATSSPAPHCSDTRRTAPSKAASGRFTRRLTV